MYNIENIRNMVSAYCEEVESLESLKEKLLGEVGTFNALALDFVGTAKVTELHIGPATVKDGKVLWEKLPITREMLDNAYDAFDNFVLKQIEHIKVLKKQYE